MKPVDFDRLKKERAELEAELDALPDPTEEEFVELLANYPKEVDEVWARIDVDTFWD